MKKIYLLLIFSFTVLSSFAQIGFEMIYGGNGSEEGRSAKQTYDGGYIVLGSTSSFGLGLMDVFLIKVDSVGERQWQKTYGGVNVDKGYSLDITSDSGLLFVALQTVLEMEVTMFI